MKSYGKVTPDDMASGSMLPAIQRVPKPERRAADLHPRHR
jgi:hypothetical protein